MSSQKVSPNSAEIVAQLEAGRKGVKAKFSLRFRIASAVLTLLMGSSKNSKKGELAVMLGIRKTVFEK